VRVSVRVSPEGRRVVCDFVNACITGCICREAILLCVWCGTTTDAPGIFLHPVFPEDFSLCCAMYFPHAFSCKLAHANVPVHVHLQGL
jgi:hypothetical protein